MTAKEREAFKAMREALLLCMGHYDLRHPGLDEAAVDEIRAALALAAEVDRA